MSRKRAILLAAIVLILGSGAGYLAIVRPAWLPFGHEKQPPDPLAVFFIEQNENPVRMEAGFEGHRDLQFENRSDRTFKVGLDVVDCDCVGVKMCLLPSTGTNANTSTKGQVNEEPNGQPWQTLELRRNVFKVPPHERGIIRLTWQTKTATQHIFWAQLLMNNDEVRGLKRVQVPVKQTEIVRLCAANDPITKSVDLGVLKRGEERTAHFLCFSETRDHFTLTPVEDSSDACVRYTMPQPLTEEELSQLSEKAGTPVHSGYRVGVIIRERADKSQLDLGAFRRKATWNADVFPGGLPVSAMVDGIVRGEVGLKDNEGHNSVDLGTIDPEHPNPVVFTLESRERDLDLTLDEEKTLLFLDVELLDGLKGNATASGRSWRIRVQFRSSSFFRGEFPNPERPEYDSAVVCSVVFMLKRNGSSAKTTDPSTRRLYVPVKGTVKSF